jgi:predicted HicB family RNase H-like nuclease
MTSKKKDFSAKAGASLRAASQFFSEEAPASSTPTKRTSPTSTGETTAKKAPDGYKPNPEYIETKSKRLQLVVQPSLYDRVKDKATAAGLSVNEYIHRVLEAATKE